ncbi:hypothetical protein [Streptomyces sp. MUM 178J]|uniref:hypothetical protein n=1 Tax=Streptomyces sp. MUM 178J TaxID=2791991 RepID=UPI001F04FCAD|nr:hypothetical protein [Streptomyces sp. MUM 178J]WRQ83466.1 hypothetical protein I3F59_020875 [Streptomyces sp. MUM 178J]
MTDTGTDTGLRAVTAAKVHLSHWRDAVLEGVGRRREAGQGAIEYVGITILVVAIVILLLNTNIGSEIANTFTAKIRSVLNSGGGGG